MELCVRNETFASPACVAAQTDAQQSGAGNGSLETSNITCCNVSSILIPPHVRQRDEDHTLRILLYSLIFFLSVVGNLLIIVVLTVNKRMRTVTNSFLLSLAVSDLMMAIFCMPFTLIPSILKDFIFGATMCKIVSYLMGRRKQITSVVWTNMISSTRTEPQIRIPTAHIFNMFIYKFICTDLHILFSVTIADITNTPPNMLVGFNTAPKSIQSAEL